MSGVRAARRISNGDVLDRLRELRWWTLDELAQTTAELSPRDLPGLISQLLRDGPPSGPISVGV